MPSSPACNMLASPLTILVGMRRAKLVAAHIDAAAELGVQLHRLRLLFWLLGCMQAAPCRHVACTANQRSRAHPIS